MKRIYSTLLTLMLILAAFAIPQGYRNVQAASTTIDLLSINDLHGRLEQAGKDPGIAKLVGYVKQYQAANPNSVVLGAGDLFQGSPISNLTQGESVARALKELNMPYSAIGNHEFDWDPAEVGIPRWEKAGGMKFLAANIYDTKTKQRATFAKPTAMITVGGKKIGLIGIATPETAYKTNIANIQGLEFRDPVNDINTLAVDLKAQGANAVVVLSHLGAMQDKAGVITGEAAVAAQKIKGVDAIISGHTHQTIKGKVNGVSIVQASANGRAIGHTMITFDDITGKVTDVTPKVDALTPQISTMPVDKVTADIIAMERKNLGPLLDVVVANNPSELKHGRFDGMSPLGQYFSYLSGQQLIDKGYLEKQPIVLMNGGGFRDSIAAGPITQGTMYNILPFDNFLVSMDLTREQLKQNIENGIMNTDIGWVQFSGLTVYYDPTRPAGDRVTEMYYTSTNEKGTQTALAEPIVDGKLYKVVTNDFMFSGGDHYDFKGAQNVKTYDGDLLRDAVQAQLKKQGTVAYSDVTRLLKTPDEANKLPEFNTVIESVEYDLSGKMFVVDAKGNKTAVEGTHMTEMIYNFLVKIVGANSADVSQDYAEYRPSGSFIDALVVGPDGKPGELVSGQTYELIVTATDGKLSPSKAKTTEAIKVVKKYQVKVTGKRPVVEAKDKAVDKDIKTTTTQTQNKETENLPDTSGKNQINILGLPFLLTGFGILGSLIRKIKL